MDNLDLLSFIADALPFAEDTIGPSPDSSDLPSMANSIMPGESGGIPSNNMGLPLPSFGLDEILAGLPPAAPERYGIEGGKTSLPQYGRFPNSGSRGTGGLRLPNPRVAPVPRARSISRGVGRVSGNAGIDLSNLDLGQLLFLVLHPKGPAIIGMMAQAEQQKQQMEAQKQQMIMQQMQLERQNQLQDLNTRLTLNQIGAVPSTQEPGTHPTWWGRQQETIKTPVGNYALPTEQRQQQLLRDQEEAKAQAAARAEMIKAEAKARAENLYSPRVPLAPDFNKFFNLDSSIDSLTEKQINAMVRQYNALKKKPEDKIQMFQNGDGTITVVRAGAQSSTTETVEGGKAGGAAGETPSLTYRKARDQYVDDLTEWEEAKKEKEEAQKLIDKATALDQTRGMAGKPGDPNTDPEWKAARQAAQDAQSHHPGIVEFHTDPNGYPNVQIVKKRPTFNPATATGPAKAAAGPALTEEQQKRDLALSNYRKMSPSDPNREGARKWFIGRFGIDPDTIK